MYPKTLTMYDPYPGTALQVHNDAYSMWSSAVGPNLFGLWFDPFN